MSLIRLIYVSYMHKKKYMMLAIYQIIGLVLIILITKNEYARFEVMLFPDYYQNYISSLFFQIFLILNAMFVLFLSIDHDQTFFKPLISYFKREKVFVAKYIFFVIHILIFYLFMLMIYISIPKLLIDLDMIFNVLMFIDIGLDMFIVLNFILIFIKDKHRTLAILIVLIYILLSLFIPNKNMYIYYMIPMHQFDKAIDSVELSYKLCYISLGMSIYFLKSLKEDI